MTQSSAPEHKGRGTAETTSNQLLGGLRAVPLLALWGEVRDAERRGQWDEQFVLYDMIGKLAPNNAAIVYYQARMEALRIAAQQPTRAAAWNWVRQALERLIERRTRLGGSALIEEGIWDVCYNAGRRFPLQVALAIADDQDDEALEDRALDISTLVATVPAIESFIEVQELTLAFDESAEFQRLSDQEQTLLMLVEEVRWQALRLVAQRGLQLRRGQSQDLAFKYLISLRRLGDLTGDEPARNQLRALARQGLTDEVARLRSLGEERRAVNFEEHMDVLIGRWMRGEPEPME